MSGLSAVGVKYQADKSTALRPREETVSIENSEVVFDHIGWTQESSTRNLVFWSSFLAHIYRCNGQFLCVHLQLWYNYPGKKRACRRTSVRHGVRKCECTNFSHVRAAFTRGVQVLAFKHADRSCDFGGSGQCVVLRSRYEGASNNSKNHHGHSI